MNHSQYKILNTAALFSFGVVLLAMLFQWIAAPAYRASNNDLLAKTVEEDRWVLPHHLYGIIQSGQMEKFLFVDLRTTGEYSQGSLPGAVNVPFENLLDRKPGKKLKSDKPLILFSGSESLTSVAGMMLHAKGYGRVFTLANDYQFVTENVLDNYAPSAAMSKGEKARFDFNRYFKTNPNAQDATSKPQPKIIETEVIQAAGGC
jgi:rhodanese-related sulfurtransferase